jgi:kinesin family protein 3/17
MNDVSSRSHAVFMIIVEQLISDNELNGQQVTKVGRLNLVDLAGSERTRVTGATGKQLEESKKINKSLSALGNVINALTDPKGRTHIPYRDSKLTRLLENSLGGNCRTTMIGMISPAECSFSESLSTLNFAKRAKSIKNRAIVNEDIDHNALIRQYENELKKLRRELEEKDRLLRDNNFIMELEEQKKEAERDKNEAIQALEEASIKYLQERDEKKKLENKIQLMNFQMIPGGQKISIEETPQFQDLLQKHQILLEKDFQEKLDEIEQEREALAASKEQVDSYNKLLYKQRNIMVGLTSSLNERDENIAQLQEEIEAYEKINKEMEEKMKIKDKRILLLEDLLRKNNIDVPEREKENEIEKVVSKVNNDEKNKSLNNKKQKLYMKYIDNNLDIDDKNNDKINENDINIMLTPEEKINELTGIIKEKEKEISIMKKVSNKIYNKTLSTSTENFTKENNDENNNKTQPLRKRKNDLEIISQLNDLKSKYSMNESFSKDIAEIINKLDNKEEEDESQTKNSSSSNINVKNTNITFKPIISNNVGISHPENTIKGIKITPYKKEKENGK